jgi:hypothetical protein
MNARPKFDVTYCSNCGRQFGPGDHGYSHCEQHMTPQQASEKARETRAEVYAQWIADDCDGLATALTVPSVFPHTTAELAKARAHVALALSRIDHAIERDNQAHQENR